MSVASSLGRVLAKPFGSAKSPKPTRRPRRTPSPVSPRLAPSQSRPLTPPTDFPFEIVGESHYQDAIARVVAASENPGRSDPSDSAYCCVTAMLVPQDDNPYDQMAVRVEVDGHRVGYLNRDDALRHRALAASLPSVPAVIIGGWDRGGDDRGFSGVRLAIRIDTWEGPWRVMPR